MLSRRPSHANRHRSNSDLAEANPKKRSRSPSPEDPRKKLKVTPEKKTVEPEIEQPVVPQADPEQLRQERLARWARIRAQNQEPEPTPTPQSPLKSSRDQQPLKSSRDRLPAVETKTAAASESSEIDMFNTDSDSDVEMTAHKGHGHVRNMVGSAADQEGYYRPQLGEILNSRYRVFGYFGKGTFGSVLKATDLETDQTVAIKLLRNHDHMARAGQEEMKILELLTATDADARGNIVRLLTTFNERDHLCLVFEALDLNARQLIKVYGGNKGLGIEAVRLLGIAILSALLHMKKNGIIHGDLKPDNLLISKDRTSVKVGDLGSALMASEPRAAMPHLVSPWYRPPEIILGAPFGTQIDVFSLGCCLYEFATGQVLFRSTSPGDHLHMIMAVGGKFPKKLINQGALGGEYFADDYQFLQRITDVATDNALLRKVKIAGPTRFLTKEILASFKQYVHSEVQANLLADLIIKCVVADPDKRITAENAIRHPFFSFKPPVASVSSPPRQNPEKMNIDDDIIVLA